MTLPVPPHGGSGNPLRRLSAKDIEFLALYYFDHRSYAEIAAYYGIAKQSARDRIMKCLRYLKADGVPMPQRTEQPRRTMERFSLDPAKLDAIMFKHRRERHDDGDDDQ